MTELAVAAFAAETGSHVLNAPSGARWSAFVRSFREADFRAGLDARGVRFLARSDPAFPPLLRAIHDFNVERWVT